MRDCWLYTDSNVLRPSGTYPRTHTVLYGRVMRDEAVQSSQCMQSDQQCSTTANRLQEQKILVSSKNTR